MKHFTIIHVKILFDVISNRSNGGQQYIVGTFKLLSGINIIQKTLKEAPINKVRLN